MQPEGTIPPLSRTKDETKTLNIGSVLSFLYVGGVLTLVLFQAALSVGLGGSCIEPSICKRSVEFTQLLPTQVLLMSILVFREKSNAIDVLRCWAACKTLATASSAVRDLRFGAFYFMLLSLIVYGQTSISLYMYHRFVFHAHWSLHAKGLDRVMWGGIRANHIMHYHEHHKHCLDPKKKLMLAKIERVISAADASAKYPDEWLLRRYLGYTDGGITIKTAVGCLGAFMFFGILPSGTLAILDYSAGDPVGAISHLLGAMLGMFLTMVHHDKYHADNDAIRKVYAEKPLFRWFWLTDEMQRLRHGHILHHEGRQDHYYSMIPFDDLFVYPFFPDDSTSKTISLRLNALRVMAITQLQSLLAMLSRCVPTMRLVAILGAHVKIFWCTDYTILKVVVGGMHLVYFRFAFCSWQKSMPHRPGRNHPFCISKRPRPPVKANSTSSEIGEPNLNRLHFKGNKHALDMDHIHVPLLPFLAGYYLLVPNATLLWLSASVHLVLRQKLYKIGLLRIEPCDYEATVAKLCLDGFEAMNFIKILDSNIAEFCWENISYMAMDATVQNIKKFRILIDLDTKRMQEATVNDRPVSSSQALSLLWFDTVFGVHVKIHALANWGITSQPLQDKQLAWMQAVTVLYNYFGFTTFSETITRIWYSTGLTSQDFSDISVASYRATASGVPFHGSIHQLAKHSSFVNFVVKVHNKFVKDFIRYADDFPGADAEALFQGTLMHGLDHVMMDVNIPEPLWLDTTDERFGATAELMRHVRVGFVPDLPFLLFNQRCKDMRHPLFQNIFKFANSIDPWLAHQMDAGICK